VKREKKKCNQFKSSWVQWFRGYQLHLYVIELTKIEDSRGDEAHALCV
jgi:hypothetical protein